MILSNEPGYYREGAYGIRIENLVLVCEAQVPAGGETPMHRFETLTLAPIDRRLIVPSLMTAAEIAWLDGYHARVCGALAGLLDSDTRAWLIAATRPLC
jgi:Xaa-Pro aminopeptidase